MSPVCVRAGAPTRISNSGFEGQVLFFVRDSSTPLPAGGSKVRYWELQVQGRFLHEVDSFFMGLELSEPIKMSLLFRGLSGTILSFVKSFEADVHASFGASKASGLETPHLVSPLFKGVDAVVETVDGTGPPPELGTDLTAGPKVPKSERPQRVRTDATYTMCVFSTFIDLFAWKVKGLPGGSSLDMNSFFRDAALRIVCYSCVHMPHPPLACARATGRQRAPRPTATTATDRDRPRPRQPEQSAESGSICPPSHRLPRMEGARRRDVPHYEHDKSYLIQVQVSPPHLRLPSPLSQQNTPTEIDLSSCVPSSAATTATAAATAAERASASGGPASDERPTRNSAGKKRTKQRHSSSLRRPRVERAASPPAVATPPTASRLPRSPVDELPTAPPLFRYAISNVAGSPLAIEPAADDIYSQEMAQQRLLMWMAGARAAGSPGKRASRLRSGYNSRAVGRGGEAAPPTRTGWLAWLFGRGPPARQSSPWLSIVADMPG